MRIADNMNYNQSNRNIQKNRNEMNELQNQAATQKRINKPSDDPVGAARVLGARTELVDLEQFKKNLNVAKSFMEYTDQSLGEISEILSRAKELAIAQSSSGTTNAVTRATTANEIEQLHRNLVQIGNRKLGERFLFGGYQTTHSPFKFDGQYRGDDGEIMIEVNKGTFVSMNVPGSKALMGKDSFRRGGEADSLNAPQSLADLQAIAEARDMTDTDQQPEEVKGGPHNLSPDYNPNLKNINENQVKMRGPASLGSSTPIPSNPDQKIRAEEPEENAKSAVEEDNKSENVFRTLKALEVALKANDSEGIRDQLETLDHSINQVVMVRSQLGARVNTVDKTLESLHKATADTKALASSYEDADAFQVFSDITKNENTLKATLNTSSKLVQMSLLDFLK